MKVLVALAALLQLAHCGHVSVNLPYLSPAGVTYVNGYEGHAYAAAAIPAKIEAHHVGYAAAQVPAVAAVPFVKHVPTVSQVPVTTFQHEPAVIEKQVDVLRPAISTKKIEVRRPAIQKQFYDIEQRTIIRPAGSALVELDEPTSKLQKGPAIVQPLAHGAALPEAHLLAHPQPTGFIGASSSTPGPILASTAAPAAQEAVVVENAEFRQAQFRSLQQTSANILEGQQRFAQEQQQQRRFQMEQQLNDQEQQRQYQFEQQARAFERQQSFGQDQQQQQQQFQLQEQSRANLLNEQQQQFQLQQQELLRIGQEQLQRAQQMHQQFQLQQQQQQLQLQQEELNQLGRANQLQQFDQQQQLQRFDQQQQLQRFDQQQQLQPAMERRFGQMPMQFQQQQQQYQQQLQQQEQQQQQQQINREQLRSAIQQNQISGVETRSNGSPLETLASIASQEQGPSLVPSLQSSSEENQINQNKLIDLLTARGGVTEIGLGRDGQLSAIGDAGQIRARVLSATPAPLTAEPANEHVSTKRVVVSRPIETLQELDIVEPATKVERVAYQHPTFIKTARLDHVQVHGSVPVVGKALTPAVAHAAVPVYHKTISPAYGIYH